MNEGVMAAFDQGQIPAVACINKATVSLGVGFDALVNALQEFVDSHFAPIWGTPAKLTKSSRFIPGAWALAFLDNADVQNALGYHELTPDGLPLAKVFVKTTIADAGKVSVTASHELGEMLVDPATNMCATGPKNRIYAYEIADAVEEESFPVQAIPMTDFVHPAYFEVFRGPGTAQFDQLKLVHRPFQLLKGGYMGVFANGKWTQIFGSAAKRKRFQIEQRRGHLKGDRVHQPMRRSRAD